MSQTDLLGALAIVVGAMLIASGRRPGRRLLFGPGTGAALILLGTLLLLGRGRL